MILRFFLMAAVLFATPVFSQSKGIPLPAAYYHYVAPQGATLTGPADGSQENPWPSVGAAISSGEITGGETLLLMDGDHGALKFYQISFPVPVVIKSMNDKAAHFEKITIGDKSGNLIFENLSVWPSDPAAASGVLIYSNSTSHDVIIDGLDVRSDEKAADFFNWDLADWQSRSINGIILNGNNSAVRNNNIIGVSFAIEVWGDDSSIINNTIDGFSGDGLRALGQRNIIRGNRVTNAFKVSGNHDDGIQSWVHSGRASVEDLVIENNVIIEWTGPAGHPLRSPLQGIGLFGGYYDNLIVRNNSVAVTQYHGISVYAGRNATVVNNTVVHNDGVVGGRPWLGIFDRKTSDAKSTNVLVANNVAMLLRGASESVVFIDNSVIFYPKTDFVDIASFDFRPTADSGFVDTANASYAPLFDVSGNVRPIGNGPDRGAYEVGEISDTDTNTTDTNLDNSGIAPTPSSSPVVTSDNNDGSAEIAAGSSAGAASVGSTGAASAGSTGNGISEDDGSTNNNSGATIGSNAPSPTPMKNLGAKWAVPPGLTSSRNN